MVFADAYDQAKNFTRPVVVSNRMWDGTVSCAIAAFVVLNEDGWFATAAHNLGPWFAWRQHQEHIARHQEQGGTPNPKWITNHSFWWGRDGLNLAEIHVRNESDLALGRLQPFEPGIVSQYPVVKDPASLRPGTSLCRLGFPFHALTAAWDDQTEQFQLPEGALPAPLFPIEGIFTREARLEGSPRPRFIETSSPGLRGQSGGPVFDTEGRLWGIQSRTRHLDLGFSPQHGPAGEQVTEHQFLNVGLAVHPAELLDLANDKHITVTVG